jgi:HSP20 family protein
MMMTTWKELGRGLSRAWENLTEGWRELLTRCNDALTRFVRNKDGSPEADATARFPTWGLLAGEVIESSNAVVVRLEIPGVEKEDCDISIEGNTLYIRGERRFDREHVSDTYYVMERAYGSFERSIPLPRNVDSDAAEATYKNGVLTLMLPKTSSAQARRVPIQ